MKKIFRFVLLFLFTVSTAYCSNETFVIKELNLELVKCPAGSFMMGSPEEEHSRIKKEIDSFHKDAYGFEYSEELHSVNINKAFYIGKYETGTETARGNKNDALTEAVIKENAYPYNYVTCSQAEAKAESLATGRKNNKFIIWSTMGFSIKTLK